MGLFSKQGSFTGSTLVGKEMARIIYKVVALPDQSDPGLVQTAGGDVKGAISLAAEHLARVVGDMPDSSVTEVIRFDYTPTPADGHPQSRLSIYVGANADTEAANRAMRTVIEAGPLSKFYKFTEGKDNAIAYGKFRAACRICRRDALVHPLTELNPNALPWYYTCSPFQPDNSNDFMMLDRVFSDIDEHVLIDLAFRPTDVARELAAHTRYLARLQTINQTWGDPDGEPTIDLLEDDNTRFSDRNKVEPLRHRDPMADDVRQKQSDIQEGLHTPYVQFHFVVLAESEHVARLVGSLLAESGFQDGSYQIHVTTDEKLLCQYSGCLSQMDVVDHSTDTDMSRNVSKAGIPGLTRLPHIASVNELLGIWRLPVSSSGSSFCIRKDTDPPGGQVAGLLVMGYDEAGSAGDGVKKSMGHGQGISRIPRGIPLDVLVKHLFTSGMPGSGKTTSNMHLILMLHKEGIPFIVIETAKTEYRVLHMLGKHDHSEARALAGKVEVYTPGNESLSPFRFNPLQLLPGISVDEHIETLLACFYASMPLMAPLPALLGEGLEHVYAQLKAGDPPPLMEHLLRAVIACLMAKQYSPDVASNFRGALLVRVGTLIKRNTGRIFQCPVSVPDVNHLLTTPTVIELDRLSGEQASLVTLFLLTAIREALRGSSYHEKRPRIVLFIEEAHNVVGRRTDAHPSEDAADPKAFAAEYVARMLAELRALGVGIVISDQLPSAVAPEVIKNTASKIAFRQVAKEDREQIGAAMLFGPIEDTEIARLRTGSAYLFTEGYFGPRRIQTVNLHEKYNLTPPTDSELQQSIQDATWWQEAKSIRRQAELNYAGSLLNSCSEECADLGHQAKSLLVEYLKNLEDKEGDPARLEALEKSLRSVRRKMETTIAAFEMGPFKRYVPQQTSGSPLAATLDNSVKSLVSRFASTRQGAVAVIDQIEKALQ
jgi:hypothetical protein